MITYSIYNEFFDTDADMTEISVNQFSMLGKYNLCVDLNFW